MICQISKSAWDSGDGDDEKLKIENFSENEMT